MCEVKQVYLNDIAVLSIALTEKMSRIENRMKSFIFNILELYQVVPQNETIRSALLNTAPAIITDVDSFIDKNVERYVIDPESNKLSIKNTDLLKQKIFEPQLILTTDKKGQLELVDLPATNLARMYVGLNGISAAKELQVYLSDISKDFKGFITKNTLSLMDLLVKSVAEKNFVYDFQKKFHGGVVDNLSIDSEGRCTGVEIIKRIVREVDPYTYQPEMCIEKEEHPIRL